MKMINKTALVLGIAALAATTAVAKPSKTTDTLHFAIHSALTDTGVEPGSAGTVSANEVRQKGTVIQKLDVTVSGLTTNTGYSLVATTGGGTTDLGGFTTDANGRATVHLGSGKGGGNSTNSLPDGFELAQITKLEVDNGSQAVLTTDGSTPTSFQYSIKRDISTNGVTGLLQIKANTKTTKFSLNASGLTPSTDYALFFNGAQVQTNTSDSKGRLKINSAPTPSNILDLNTVELRDSTGTITILSTTLP